MQSPFAQPRDLNVSPIGMGVAKLAFRWNVTPFGVTAVDFDLAMNKGEVQIAMFDLRLPCRYSGNEDGHCTGDR